jgi:hypothetical protein
VQSSHKHPVKVVIEGFDGESRISLSEIFNDLHIKYVQGHMIRKASPFLSDLDEDIKKYIRDKLTLSEENQKSLVEGDEAQGSAKKNKSDVQN